MGLEMKQLNRDVAGFEEYLEKGLNAEGRGHELAEHMTFLRALPQNQVLGADVLIRIATLIVTAVPKTAEGKTGILVELTRPKFEIRWISCLGKLVGWVNAGQDLNNPWTHAVFEQSRQLAQRIAETSGIDMARIDICSYGDDITRRRLIDQKGSAVFLSELSMMT